MQIALYQPQYQTAVINLILTIQQQEFELPITLADQSDLLDIPTVYQQGQGNFWVALESDRVIGTIAAIDIGEHQLALRKMFVATLYRRTGVGNQLLNTLCRWAVQRQVSDIYLGTVEVFKGAHQFYENYGFRQIDKLDLPTSFPIMQGDNRFYQLVLS